MRLAVGARLNQDCPSLQALQIFDRRGPGAASWLHLASQNLQRYAQQTLILINFSENKGMKAH